MRSTNCNSLCILKRVGFSGQGQPTGFPGLLVQWRLTRSEWLRGRRWVTRTVGEVRSGVDVAILPFTGLSAWFYLQVFAQPSVSIPGLPFFSSLSLSPRQPSVRHLTLHQRWFLSLWLLPGWAVTCTMPHLTSEHSRCIPFIFMVMWLIPLFSLKRTMHTTHRLYFGLSGKFGKPQRLCFSILRKDYFDKNQYTVLPFNYSHICLAPLSVY